MYMMEVQIILLEQDSDDHVWCSEGALASTLVRYVATPQLPHLSGYAATVSRIEALIEHRSAGLPYSHIEAELGVEIYPDRPPAANE